ncbi:MAG: peptidylprolyl isomerase [Cellvibrionaceae bacterium]
MYHLTTIKKLILLSTLVLKILLLKLFFLSSSAHAYEKLDKAVAIVEDSVILESELKRRILQLSIQRPGITINENTRKQMLDQLVSEQLQLRIADRIKLSVNETEIDSAIANIKNGIRQQNSQQQRSQKNTEQQGTPEKPQQQSLQKPSTQQVPADFASYLAAQQLTEQQLRQSIAKELKIQKVQEGNINRRIRITEREIDNFLESKAGQEWLQIRFRISHILLPFDGNDDGKAIAMAQTLTQKLRQGTADFSQMAIEYSKGPNAPKGGDLGWREKEKLPALFVEQITPLKPGQITQPFRSNAGIHILKLNQRTGAEPIMVERHKVRHILIKPTVLFTEKEAKEKIDKLYQQLQNGEDFIEMAKEQTEDTGSKFNGGELGWSTPGQFVPEFEKMMKSTPIGSISKPFRSQFGWHVLKVEDTKVEDMFDRVKRNQVVSILRKRRFQDELQLWLQEIREDAYVEILI